MTVAWPEPPVPSRQEQILEVIHSRGGATVLEVYESIPNPPPSVSGIKTLVRRLAARGVLRSRPRGRHRELLYLPMETDENVALRAFERLSREHFGGSRSKALTALRALAAEARADAHLGIGEDEDATV